MVQWICEGPSSCNGTGDQLSKEEALEDPVAVVVHLVAVAVDTTAAVAVVMKARTIMAVVEVEDPLISTGVFPTAHILPRNRLHLYRKSSNFFEFRIRLELESNSK